MTELTGAMVSAQFPIYRIKPRTDNTGALILSVKSKCLTVNFSDRNFTAADEYSLIVGNPIGREATPIRPVTNREPGKPAKAASIELQVVLSIDDCTRTPSTNPRRVD